MIRFLFRLIFKLLFFCVLIVAGVGAYLYVQYKPLIDFAGNPEAYTEGGAVSIATPKIQDKPLAKNTVDARNLSVRREVVPSRVPASNVGEALSIRKQNQAELPQVKETPVGLFVFYVRSKIQFAREKLSEVETKLARAHPQDPAKQAKVAKARSLVPKAHNLLNQADSWVDTFQ